MLLACVPERVVFRSEPGVAQGRVGFIYALETLLGAIGGVNIRMEIFCEAPIRGLNLFGRC